MFENFEKSPHDILGPHQTERGGVIRLWSPKFFQKKLEVRKKGFEKLKQIDKKGLFELLTPYKPTYLDYQITYESGFKSFDPYAFSPTFSKKDRSLFSQGKHKKIYQVMGGRLTEHQGVLGVKFSLWAPHARSVSVMGDFNCWNPLFNPMRLLDSSGIWELFIPGLEKGERYKFSVVSTKGELFEKADPYAFQGEMRPLTASIVNSVEERKWQDQEWMEKRGSKELLSCPINIYEIHLGSWMKRGGDFINYSALAPLLSAYCKEMGYTHVEFMPIMGHPLDESWGYQVTGFYAISSRYGSIEEFQFLVDHLHQKGIGVILDWVPGHFPEDAHSIAKLDGTCLYEHSDPRRGFHPDWTTCIFDYGRCEVRNFLLGSAFFYLDKMHVDGLRVDAVSSMVYLDYGRKEGEWIPNERGGNEHLEAIDFLQTLNQSVSQAFKGVLMIAEESHAFPNVTASVSEGGLGFNLKWSLGWMNDTLRFFATDFAHRREKKHLLEHEFEYYYNEKHLLPLSHDEVVHGKKSLLEKMPGNEWEKFANMRLLLSYMVCHPGKKLLFMGGEFGLWTEWDCKKELPWHLTKADLHQKLRLFVKRLNEIYQTYPPFWEKDFEKKGFKWVDTQETFSYLRSSEKSALLCVHNLGAKPLKKVLVPYPDFSPVEIFNSDAREYGGLGVLNEAIEGMRLDLSPFATSIICQSKSI